MRLVSSKVLLIFIDYISAREIPDVTQEVNALRNSGIRIVAVGSYHNRGAPFDFLKPIVDAWFFPRSITHMRTSIYNILVSVYPSKYENP